MWEKRTEHENKAQGTHMVQHTTGQCCYYSAHASGYVQSQGRSDLSLLTNGFNTNLLLVMVMRLISDL